MIICADSTLALVILDNGGSEEQKGGYSEEERRVLADTSTINGREYVPFMAADLR